MVECLCMFYLFIYLFNCVGNILIFLYLFYFVISGIDNVRL